MFAASSLVWSPLLGFAWLSDATENSPLASRRYRFAGRLLCGALTRFSYDPAGNLHFLTVGIELHDEPYSLEPSAAVPSAAVPRAGEPSPLESGTGPVVAQPANPAEGTIPLATVHYVEYRERDGWCRSVQGVASGGRVSDAGDEVHVLIPVDLFVSESPEPNLLARRTPAVASDETYLGTREFGWRCKPGGPLIYGTCRQQWRGPHSQFLINATGAYQALEHFELQIDGEPLPDLAEGVAGGFLLVGAGSVEELTWFRV